MVVQRMIASRRTAIALVTVLGAVAGLAVAEVAKAETYEVDYAQYTAGTFTVTATSDATAQTFISGAAVSYDGSTPILIEVSSPVGDAGTAVGVVNLYDGGTDLGRIAEWTGAGMSVRGYRRLTPTAGSHTYHAKVWKTGGTVRIYGNTGGTATEAPAFLRITRANPVVGAGATTLDELTDVNTTGKVDGSIIEWDTTSSQWEVGTDDVSAGGGGGDVTVTNWPESQPVTLAAPQSTWVETIQAHAEKVSTGLWVAIGVLLFLIVAPVFHGNFRWWAE